MKSPRDILLEKHRSAEPKLDALRKEVLGGLNNKETKKQSWLAHLPENIWRELISPCRKVWAGLAVVWLAILVANASMRSPGATTVKNVSSEMATDFKQQQHLLAELVGSEERRDAEPPKKNTPQPRSELGNRFLVT